MSAAAPTAARPALGPGTTLGIDNRFLPPILITCILITAHFTFGILESFERTALAIGVAVGAEVLCGRLTHGKWPHPASAYISGISVGILIRSPFLWAYALCSLISIVSKYVLRLDGRHLWNPSNFGVCALLFLAPETVTLLSIQWGNAVWPMVVIWCLGFFTVWRVGRLHVSVAYVLSFLAFGLLRAGITGHSVASAVAPITGPMYQLLIFFMMTDPKTTVASRTGRIVVVVIISFVEMLFRLAENVYAPLYALFIVGPIAMVVESWWLRRRAAAAPAPAPAAA